jgi:2-polyprenyl-3-methyl-5-hydroxy-6-metoxy-1,4-benzoquinol methylase
LDYGCNDGALLFELARSFPNLEVIGIDKNRNAIAAGAKRIANSQISLHSPHDLVAWVNMQQEFDIILAMGVIEHVVDQEILMESLGRALKTGGRLILSVPGKNIFSWADLGNWKFYFPRMHKFYIERTKGKKFYKENFIECANGLFGDVEVGKDCHQHFSRDEILGLINASRCRVTVVDGYGFTYRVLHNIWWFAPNFLKPLLRDLILIDLRVGSSAELVLEAEK